MSSKPCHLKKLDLSHNKLWDIGVNVFPRLLANPNCNLEELRYVCIAIKCDKRSFIYSIHLLVMPATRNSAYVCL